ncbi:MAG: hypothetical protein J6W75_02470 [Bacteroidaceae bacterium]|nr:hypothetical protein [Bacteroidaceae bacterium]
MNRPQFIQRSSLLAGLACLDAPSFAKALQTLGTWTMDNGQWKMENGQWKMENGQWNGESFCLDADAFGTL